MTYWGYKFEALSTVPRSGPPFEDSAAPLATSSAQQPVNNIAQYCSVVRTGFGPTILCLGGEVDAVWSKGAPEAVQTGGKPQQPPHLVELKTTAALQSSRDRANFGNKLLKYWAQSFLLGVQTISVGFRSPHGHLLQIDELETMSIPHLVQREAARQQQQLLQNTPRPEPLMLQSQSQPRPLVWDGDLCVNFTTAVLAWLHASLVGKQGVWRIRRRPGAAVIELFQITPTGHGHILTQEFLDWRNWLDGIEDSSV